jgi:hypothetical protein
MATNHQVFEQHRTLRLAIDNIRSLLGESSRLQLAGSLNRRIAEDLREFESALSQHFVREEQGGYMAGVLRDHPELLQKVIFLEREHQLIAAMLKAVQAAWPETADSHANSRPQRKLEEALDRLEAHEASENGLLQEVICQDGGTAG